MQFACVEGNASGAANARTIETKIRMRMGDKPVDLPEETAFIDPAPKRIPDPNAKASIKFYESCCREVPLYQFKGKKHRK